MAMTDCPDPERLRDLAQDRVLPAEAKALCAHLGRCPTCEAKARSMELDLLQGKGLVPGMPWWILPLTLSLMALAGFFVLARWFGR